MLLSRLPAGALTAAEWAHQGEASRWSRTDQLLAGVVDLLADGFWRNEAIWVQESSRRAHPEALPRPGLEIQDRRDAFRSRFASLSS